MKVDRRSFLGLGLGAVAGIAVSPIGMKLTDDSAIWTQNWPWTPVPVDGEVTYENSVCSLCPGSCGISVRKINNRPVKIEGLAGYPINDGGACLHGIAGLQYLYDPSRVKTPLKKNGDKFEEIKVLKKTGNLGLPYFVNSLYLKVISLPITGGLFLNSSLRAKNFTILS